MIVVSDTSPISYLVEIEHEAILPALFSTVFLPPAVELELLHPAAPKLVFEWVRNLPEWIQVVASPTFSPIPGVHRGESQAIALAGAKGCPVLIDDKKNISAARALGVPTFRTVSVLAKAAKAGLLDFESSLIALSQTSFYIQMNRWR